MDRFDWKLRKRGQEGGKDEKWETGKRDDTLIRTNDELNTIARRDEQENQVDQRRSQIPIGFNN